MMKDFFSGRKSHCTWCRYAYCRQKSSKKPIYQGTKCSLAARNPLLHQLQKFLCIFAEELAHYKSILNPAEMKDRIEKNIDSFIMPVCPVLLRTYPESNMWYGPCDLWEVMTDLKEFILGWWDWAKTQKIFQIFSDMSEKLKRFD